jgi:hypothetical protein
MTTTATKTKRSNAATHIGSCQACGRSQKLPRNVLSLHGYTVEWSFFSGICPGSRHEPFEVSCKLIEKFISDAQTRLSATRVEIETLKHAPDANIAWVREYISSKNRYQKSGYAWRQVEITSTVKTSSTSDFTWMNFTYVNSDGKVTKLDCYEGDSHYAKSLEAAIAYLNDAYIKGVLLPLCSRLTDYINWQTKRVTEWKPGKLKPIVKGGR